MTIFQVAKVAGVSPATVSRVMNNRPGVSSAYESSVKQAMKHLGYTPPVRRRGRRVSLEEGMRTRNIAVITLGIDQTLIHVPVFASVLHGIHTALREKGLNMLLAEVPYPGQLPPMITRREVDGLILEGIEPPETMAAVLRRFPAVWVLTLGESGAWGDHVGPDEVEIGRLAAKYLLKTGHKHLAFFNPEPFHPAARIRGEAFRSTVLQASAKVEMLIEGDQTSPVPWRLSITQDQVRALLDRFLTISPRPTGMFVWNDLVTAMVYRTMLERGLRPGDDLTVVSCDNEQRLLVGLEPRPASVDIEAQTIGKRAVDQLLWRIRNPDQAQMRILITPTLAGPGSEK